MKHSADEDTIKKKMKLAFDFCHNMVLDVLSVFPRFKDVKGLVIIFFIILTLFWQFQIM